jgi:hypothetical protein
MMAKVDRAALPGTPIPATVSIGGNPGAEIIGVNTPAFVERSGSGIQGFSRTARRLAFSLNLFALYATLST